MFITPRSNRGLSIEPFDGAQRDFESLLGRMVNSQSGTGRTKTDRMVNTQSENKIPVSPYGVDVRQDGDHLYIEAEMPGFKKEEVDITLEDQTLTISGERRETPENPKKGDWLLNERRTSRFLRRFTLPSTVSEQSVNAKLEHGVLTITLSKREESKPRKISVL